MNELGQIVLEEWKKSASIRAEIELGDFVIMPNHFHAIVIISDEGIRPNMGRGDPPIARTTDPPVAPTGPAPKSIGALMAGFKSATTKRINICRNLPGHPVWQRNYWDNIIRDDHSFQMITEYILSNPSKWEEDKLFHGGNW